MSNSSFSRWSNTSVLSLANITQIFNDSLARWYEDDGSMAWPFVVSFIWVILASIFCLVLFFTNRKVRGNRSGLLSLNLLAAVFINEVVFSVTFIYHDVIGSGYHWTFGVHYCRFVLLAQVFAGTLQSYTVLLVTVDSWFQAFSPSRYNERIASRRIFTVLLISPWVITTVCVMLTMLPVSPKVGKLIEMRGQTFCVIAVASRSFSAYLGAIFTFDFFLPATLSLILAGALLAHMCRHLSVYHTFGSDPISSPLGDGEARLKHIVVPIVIMTVLFQLLVGSHMWSLVLSYYSLLRIGRTLTRIYWCLLPLIWLTLQPELLAVVTSTVRKCCRGGAREMLTSCANRVRGKQTNNSGGIREYNIDKDDNRETMEDLQI